MIPSRAIQIGYLLGSTKSSKGKVDEIQAAYFDQIVVGEGFCGLAIYSFLSGIFNDTVTNPPPQYTEAHLKPRPPHPRLAQVSIPRQALPTAPMCRAIQS
jgi:hypothetical protein